MPRPESGFSYKERLSFEKAFPQAEIKAFQEFNLNNPNFDWVDIFDALSAFDFPKIKPDGKYLVIALFSIHNYGSRILMKDTDSGVQVYRRDLVPLLRASQDVYFQSFDMWEDKYKKMWNYFSINLTKK